MASAACRFQDNVYSAADCLSNCRGTTGCVAFTYIVSDGLAQMPGAVAKRCYLKGSLPVSGPSTCQFCHSGVLGQTHQVRTFIALCRLTLLCCLVSHGPSEVQPVMLVQPLELAHSSLLAHRAHATPMHCILKQNMVTGLVAVGNGDASNRSYAVHARAALIQQVYLWTQT